MGVRIVTDKALDAWLARHQEVWLSQRQEAVADDFVRALKALPLEDCTHNNRPSCPKCSARRTVAAAVAVVRETGGLK